MMLINTFVKNRHRFHRAASTLVTSDPRAEKNILSALRSTMDNYNREEEQEGNEQSEERQRNIEEDDDEEDHEEDDEEDEDGEDPQINVAQHGHINTCVIHTSRERKVGVNISYNIFPESPPNAASTLDVRGRVRFKLRFPHLNIDETVLNEIQRNPLSTQENLKGILFRLMEVRRGCVELVTEPDVPDAVTQLVQAIKDGKVDEIVLDILKNDSVSELIDSENIDVSIDIYIPSELEHLLNVNRSLTRPDVLWPVSLTSVPEQSENLDDLSLGTPRDSGFITTSRSPPPLKEEDVGMQFLFRHMNRRFPRDKLEDLQNKCRNRLGKAYGMDGQLVTSLLEFLHQLNQKGHVTRNNVTLLWTLMLDIKHPELLEAILDYEESVEAQVREWLDRDDVCDHYGYISCGMSPYYKTMSAKRIQVLTNTVYEATGAVPSHVLVRWRSIGGPLSVTMVIARKVQAVNTDTDLKEELKKLGVDTVDIEADPSNLKTRPKVSLHSVQRWWIPESQDGINKFHRQWKSSRNMFIKDLQEYRSFLSRPYNLMIFGLCGVGKSSSINSFVAAVTGHGFREVSQAGWHGRTAEPLTMSTQRYINCGVTENHTDLFPTLFDTMGFPDEATEHLREVTKLYIGGYIGTEVPTAQILEFAQDHGWHSLRQKYDKYHPEDDVDRIIYVISARQNLPINHMAVIREAAAGRPIYLIITKTDVVGDIDLESLKERAQSALGVDKDHVFTMINYSDDTTPERTTRMYPALDEANVKILMEICRPVEWDRENKITAEPTLQQKQPTTPEDAASIFAGQLPSTISSARSNTLLGLLELCSIFAAIIAVVLYIKLTQRQYGY